MTSTSFWSWSGAGRSAEAPSAPRSRLRRFVRRAAVTLLGTSSELTSEPQRRKARLFATLGLMLSLIEALAAVVSAFVVAGPVGFQLTPVLAGQSILTAIVYALSRTRHVQAAEHMFLTVQWAVPMGAMILDAVPGERLALTTSAWLSVPLLLALGASSVKTTVLVTIAALALPISTAFLHLDSPPDDVPHAFTLVFTMGVLSVWLNRHRHKIERDRSSELVARSAELVARNAELSDLGARLAAQTKELAASNVALDAAYKELQRNQQSLLLSEKMASLGRLTAGIAHEMGSPLAAVRTALAEARTLTDEYSQSIDDSEVSPEDHHAIAKDLARSLDLAIKASERAASFVRNIKNRTRDVGAHDAQPFDAVATVDEALHMLAHEITRTKSRVAFEHATPQIRLVGFPGKLAQVVTNLVTNALDACAEQGGGHVGVHLSKDAGEVELTVVDDGPGIPEEHMQRIFEPLFTTKPVGQGTGLGLTIVHDIVVGDLRGALRVENLPGRGARFVVRFPAAPTS